jgi:LPS export ABC transporter protein LptC
MTDGRTEGQRDRGTEASGRKFFRPFVRLSVCPFLLVACSDPGVRPTAVTAVADSADQVMFKMSTKITNEGVLRSYVEADTAYMYQRSQMMDLRRFTARLLDEKGNLKSTLTADQGFYTTYSNKLDARGHVVIISTDGDRITTEHLIYDKMVNQVLIDTAFVYDSPKGRLTGNRLVSDIDFNNVTVDQPKGRQKGKGFLLPGQ